MWYCDKTLNPWTSTLITIPQSQYICKDSKSSNNALGRFWSVVGQDPSVSKSNRLHVGILSVFLYSFEVYSTCSSKTIGDFLPEVLHFNWLFLKLMSSSHQNFPCGSNLWNCWGLCWKTSVGHHLLHYYQSETPTDSVMTGRCDQPLNWFTCD